MKLIATQLLGEIEVKSGTLLVADPCYLPDDPAKPENNAMYGGALVKGVTGIGQCYVDVADEGPWGERVSTLRVVFATRNEQTSEVWVGSVGVDSGQMSMLDEALVSEWGGDLRQDESRFDDFTAYCKSHEGEFNYAGVCNLTMPPERGGTIGSKIVASQSGIGDGSYPVIVRQYAGGAVESVEVRFLDDEEEEAEDSY